MSITFSPFSLTRTLEHISQVSAFTTLDPGNNDTLRSSPCKAPPKMLLHVRPATFSLYDCGGSPDPASATCREGQPCEVDLT